jgi:glucan phosphoethanolaminetransferase (alkaline phosphatase superfamily)
MPEEESKAHRESRPAVIWVVGIVATYIVVASVWRAVVQRVQHQPQVAFTTVRSWVVFGLYFFVAVGLFRRWKLSRWIAAVLLVVWAIFSYWAASTAPQMKPGEEWTQADGAMDVITGYVVATLMLAAAGLIAFQPEVSRYFGPGSKREGTPNKSTETMSPNGSSPQS